MSIEWKREKEFGRDGSMVRVTVNVLALPFGPKYSVEVGTYMPEQGRVGRHVQTADDLDVAIELMLDAHEYILGKQGEWLAKESARMDREKEKRARHLQNVEKRRAENRERASQRGSGGKRKAG